MKRVIPTLRKAFEAMDCGLRDAAKRIGEPHHLNLFYAMRTGKIGAKLALKLERHLGLNALELYIMQAKEKLEQLRRKKYSKAEVQAAMKAIIEDDAEK